MTADMSSTEKLIYAFIASKGANVDVPIKTIYHHVYGDLEDADQNRTSQQVVGAFISRINKKLSGAEIKPGRVKQTYRLAPTKA
jgi:hypothetical protein